MAITFFGKLRNRLFSLGITIIKQTKYRMAEKLKNKDLIYTYNSKF